MKLKNIITIIIIFLLLISYVIYNVLTQEEEKEQVNKIIEPIKEEITKIYVDIKGEVNNPGVYELEENIIINELINIAGGLTEKAYTEDINLSKKIENEMVIIIKSIDDVNIEKVQTDIQTNTNILVDKSIENELININSADLNLLTTLSGIGETKAKAIISYRNEVGLFKSIEDIKLVSGIGDSTYDKIKNFITI